MKKKVLLAALGILIVLQFIKIDKTNPETNPQYDIYTAGNLSPEIGSLLKNACNDCHSNHTKYPWYTSFQPFGWFVSGHIKHGRGNLNFSEWHGYSESKRSNKAEDCIEVLEAGRMPLKSYTWMHPKARLTKEQNKELIDFFKSVNQ